MPLKRFLLTIVGLVLAAHCAARSLELQAAIDLYHSRQDAAASAQLAKLTAANTSDAEAFHYLGLLALRRADLAAARAHHEKAVALAPANSAFHLGLGDAYLTTGEQSGMFAMAGWLKKCKAAYDKAVELDPANIEARANLVEFYQDVPGFMGGGMDKAYAQADEIIKLDSVRGRTARASVQVAEKKYAEAFATYDSVLVESPADYRALYGFGRLAAITGLRTDDGIRFLEKARTVPPPATSANLAGLHWRLGMLYEKKGDKRSARGAYEGALKVDPRFDRASKALRALN